MSFNSFFSDNLARLKAYHASFEDENAAVRAMRNKKESEEDPDEKDLKGNNKFKLKHPDIEDFDFKGDDYHKNETKYLKLLEKHKKQFDHKIFMNRYWAQQQKDSKMFQKRSRDKLLYRFDKDKNKKRKKEKLELERIRKEDYDHSNPASVILPSEEETEKAKMLMQQNDNLRKQNIDNCWDDLAISSVDTKDDSIPFFKDGLPPPPFRWILNAQSMSGKTTLIINLLKPKMYGDYFPKFHLYSKSIGNDPKWGLLSEHQKEWTKDEYQDDDIQQIWDEQKAKVEADGGKTRQNALLLIFDDMITSLYNRGGKPRVVQKLFMRGRHANISIIISSQQYMLIPSTVRINASALIIFEIYNVKEQENLYNEHGGCYSRAEWKAITKHVWGHPYSFLFIDYTKPIVERFKRNFQHIVYIENGGEKSENEF